MAFIPDEAILRQYDELTPAAVALYGFYCMKRNKRQGGWGCPKSTVLSAIRTMSEATYFAAKKELIVKEWIARSGDFIMPLVGFETPENWSAEDSEKLEQDSEKPESDSEKLEQDSEKPESYIRNNQPIRPAHTTNSLNQPNIVKLEEPTSPVEADPEPDKPKVARDAQRAEVVMVLERWKEVTNQPRAKLTDDRIKRIRTRLKDFSVEELCLCLDGWKLSEFHQGDNPKGKVYSKVETIFKSGDQVDSFIAEARKALEPKKATTVDSGNGADHNPGTVTFGEYFELMQTIWLPGEDRAIVFQKAKENYLREMPAAAAEIDGFARGHGLG